MATGTRPDLAYSVTYLSQFCSRPSEEHWQAAKRVLRYLQDTKNRSLRYKKTRKEVEVFNDSDWGSDNKDRKSFSGYASIVAGGAVSAVSASTVALSTVEAEFVALGEATREVLWLQNFLREINQKGFCENAIKINIDNQGAIMLAQNRASSERTKHLDLRNFFIQDVVEAKEISLVYVPTEKNIAEGVTKAISYPRLVAHGSELGMSDQGGCWNV